MIIDAVMQKKIDRAAIKLQHGELAAFPTETVYGLGADATNDSAVAKIFAMKGRPQFNPLITHVTSIEEAQRHGRFSKNALKIAEHFWPGPLTLILNRREDNYHNIRTGITTIDLFDEILVKPSNQFNIEYKDRFAPEKNKTTSVGVIGELVMMSSK